MNTNTRPKFVQFRITEEENILIQQRLKSLRLSRSEYLRELMRIDRKENIIENKIIERM